MPDTKIFSVQPRFKQGILPGSWSSVDAIFRMGTDVPPYSSMTRDMYLFSAWQNEHMIAGVFSTWVERVQSTNWKVKSIKHNANYFAELFHNAEVSIMIGNSR